jgi:hypothetical protein
MGLRVGGLLALRIGSPSGETTTGPEGDGVLVFVVLEVESDATERLSSAMVLSARVLSPLAVTAVPEEGRVDWETAEIEVESAIV